MLDQAPHLSELQQAIAFWHSRQLQTSLRSLAPDAEGFNTDWLLLEDPGLRLWAQRESARVVGPDRAQPLPEFLSLAELEDRLVPALALDGEDSPRTRLERTADLADLLAQQPLLAGTNGSVAATASAAARLADEWVELFDRWDWLICGYRRALALGHCAGQPDLSEPPFEWLNEVAFRMLASVYELARAEEGHAPDLAFWAAQRSAGRQSSPQDFSVGLLSLGEPSAVLMSAALVLGWAGESAICHAALPSHTGWRTLFPELAHLRDPLLGPPQPLGWQPIAQRGLCQPDDPERPQPLARLETLATDSLESMALAAGATLRSWLETRLSDERVPIALIATDRLVLRRLTALLGEQCPIDDPSGWSLSTTVAGTALDGLLALRSGSLSRSECLAWAANPFVQRAWLGWSSGAGQPPVEETRQDLPVADWSVLGPALYEALGRPGDWRRLSDRTLGVLRSFTAWLSLLEANAPGSDWYGSLLQAILRSGLWEALGTDDAGERLLVEIAMAETSASGVIAATSDVAVQAQLALMRLRLERARLPRRHSDAAIRVCSVEEALALGCRRVLVLGASEATFPPQRMGRLAAADEDAWLRADPPPWQEQAVFTARMLRLAERADQIRFLARSPQGPENLVWCSLVERLHLLLGVEAVSETELRPPLGEWVDPPAAILLEGPFERPECLSVREAAILLDCPYRFVWTVVKGLSGHAMPEEGPSALARGQVLHRLIDRHAKSITSGLLQADDQQGFQDLLDALLAAPQAVDSLTRADCVLVRTAGEAYWAWHARQRDAEVLASERELVYVLPRSGVRLQGRLDQVRRLADGEIRLLDFKSASPSALDGQVKRPEIAGQLQLYAALLPLAPQDPILANTAALVSLTATEGQINTMEVKVPLDPEVLDRLDELLLALAQPVSPRTLAAETKDAAKSCEYCSARPVCPAQPEVAE